MKLKIALSIVALSLVALLAFLYQPKPPSVDRQALIDKGKSYNVLIRRDRYGVPHIYGQKDHDTAYGLAFAHAEDDYKTIELTLLATRGILSKRLGIDGAANDYLVQLLKVWDIIEQKYQSQLETKTQRLAQAYADGLNHYAALNPEQVDSSILPVTGQDIVAGFVYKTPLFYGLDKVLSELFAPERQREISLKDTRTAYQWVEQGPYQRGSNTLALAPKRSNDGKTRLAINSHQPYTGPVAWYEARLKSEEGLDIVGGTFPGAPLILHGHNRDLGWAMTVNRPDLVDVYVLKMNPDNDNEYLFDGQYLPLERQEITINVKLFGPFYWPAKREILYSVHGPVIERPHGVYAIRYAGMGEIKLIEQWYRMNLAQTMEDWLAAVKMQALVSFNMGFADKNGNIAYIYNAKIPKRAEGYQWQEYLPGDTSETLWQDSLTFDELPKVINPESGFIFNTNNTPFVASGANDNPDPKQYSDTLGIETNMNNRALRALELFSSDDKISGAEFYQYKFDMTYSTQSEEVKIIKSILALDVKDATLKQAIDILKTWDYQVNPENKAASLAMLATYPAYWARRQKQSIPSPQALLQQACDTLMNEFGRLDVPWGEINRLRRGSTDLAMGGGPDTLHAVQGDGPEQGRLTAKQGDSYVLLVEWDQQGQLSSQSIHQFGSATIDENSPHYADQAPLFVKRQLKPVWFEESELLENLERQYRP